MTVYFVCRYFYPYLGGNEKQCLSLAKGLKANGIEVKVITDRFSGELLKSEEIGSVTVKRLKSISEFLQIGPSSKPSVHFLNRIFYRIRYTLTEFYFQLSVLFYLFRKRKTLDIVHFHQGSFVLFAPVLRTFIKAPILVKDSTYNGLSILRYFLIIPVPYRFFLKNLNFIALSTQIMENFVKKYEIREDRVFKIPNGVEFPANIAFTPNNNLCDDQELLFLGNFWQGDIKGLDILLRAIGCLKTKFPRIRLTIAGTGNPENYLNIIQEYDLSGNINFLGGIENPEALFSSKPIYILPSRSEGMSNSLLESMARGLPCISSNVSGSVDIIDHRINGLLFEVGLVDELVECIDLLLRNPDLRSKLGNAAIEKVRSTFQMDLIAQKYSALYTSLI